ncbi:SDR family NAD(P)-dependent oxidoreductase [Microbacterium sp. G2-8]|uniref:SDR family NAD(P)-dependent oxidoreductase n=1 Tax=Microbacterium sp. G2-8 TaxID=2842454 RepID=UPI001C8AFA99|nr:SDR family NAD(P)-dependent oxidoreductase [Microbacterium sp. G2-8]
MDLHGTSALVTGGASGLGLASAKRLADGGAHVVVVDLPTSDGAARAAEIGGTFAAADVTDPRAVAAAADAAERAAPLRALVHCAGRADPLRLVGRDGDPGSLDLFEEVVRVNLVGTFNVLRIAAARMARNEEVDGERGVCVLTASVAAWEGQIGQIAYSSTKSGVVGMTLVAARDLASKLIRVATIAPGTFDTPLLAKMSEPVRESLAQSVPHPSRLGRPEEFASLAAHIIDNAMINGETIRLDGAIRMPPR